MGRNDFVAMTTLRRWGLRAAPRYSSDPPWLEASAVAKKVMPISTHLLTTAMVPWASTRPPKLLQPRPTAETWRPDLPRFLYSTMVPFYYTLCCHSERSEESGSTDAR